MVNGSASGYFEIYIPSESPADTEVISRARLGRRAGEVSVEVFLSGFSLFNLRVELLFMVFCRKGSLGFGVFLIF